LLLGLTFGEQTEILAGNLYRALREASVFVAKQGNFGSVAGVAFASGQGDVQTAFTKVRDRQIHVQNILIGFEAIRQRPRKRRGIRIGDFKQQSVRKNSRGLGQCEIARSQRLLIDLQTAEAPGRISQGIQLKLQRILKKPILGLQVLRA